MCFNLSQNGLEKVRTLKKTISPFWNRIDGLRISCSLWEVKTRRKKFPLDQSRLRSKTKWKKGTSPIQKPS
ncbi:hypothetical protein DLM75_14165 [Leptospira stimsonii]|uniref:Uncharacterized protein n=1 Tax=Leptospira stimsonii TaxID=2202203 RepID=A0A396Z5Q0_9LEPT|nr:hypothetical protein DLM75_14165 [Leptospira stimsonii]